MNPAPDVPAPIRAPSGTQLLLQVRASGFQIYVCQTNANGEPSWTLKAPDAKLYDLQGNLIGQHYGGPTWKHQDGSEITAKLVTRVDAPDPADIPWLLLTVANRTGSGVLSQVSAIQRIRTVGGQPPSSPACSKSIQGQETRIPYEAEYCFYTNV